MSLPLIVQLLIGLCAGALAGALHFASLQHNLRLFLDGRGAAAIGLQLARLCLTVGMLVIVLRLLGLPALLAAGLGLLLARQWVVRQQKQAIHAATGEQP